MAEGIEEKHESKKKVSSLPSLGLDLAISRFIYSFAVPELLALISNGGRFKPAFAKRDTVGSRQ
jgi:hypothetical protein